MAKKTKAVQTVDKLPDNAHITGAGEIEAQAITDTLRTN